MTTKPRTAVIYVEQCIECQKDNWQNCLLEMKFKYNPSIWICLSCAKSLIDILNNYIR